MQSILVSEDMQCMHGALLHEGVRLGTIMSVHNYVRTMVMRWVEGGGSRLI